eukprot:TRINITY_DN40530_c0_g1_i1.p1 TRINITY_DN40530_c0_g1~~TRINITY_DN40530_c0_g1_i1.p1  ORF type:complete len:273 (+),score=69.64 TRINITY_DN40530_c0_g1_i1:140-958(+)
MAAPEDDARTSQPSGNGSVSIDKLLENAGELLAKFQITDRDAVDEELKELERRDARAALDTDYIPRLEERIDQYSDLGESLGTCLGGKLLSNYEGFMKGMQHVQQVDLEFAYIRVKIKNSRRRLDTADQALGQGGLYVARKHRRKERLEQVAAFAEELRLLMEDRLRMKAFALDEKYHDAIKLNSRLLHTLRSERFQDQGSQLFTWLRSDLRDNLEDMKQKLRERSQKAAANAEVDFDVDAYEKVLEALVAQGIKEGQDAGHGLELGRSMFI